jgi:hypothetical protein
MYDAEGEQAWSFTRQDAAPDFPLIIAAGAAVLPGGGLLVVNSDWHYSVRDANRVQLFTLDADHKVSWRMPAGAFDGWKRSWTEPKTGFIEHRCMIAQPLN